MNTTYRTDSVGKIKSYRETAEGFLDLFLTFARAGTLEYVRADGTVETEYVTPEALFDEESLSTATGKPITYLHPPERVTKDNFWKFARGSTGTKIVRDDPFATIVATVHDAALIDVIKSGKAREVSAGYTANVVRRGDGKLYQENRVYNHFSVVPLGRAGADVKVHFDGADSQIEPISYDLNRLHCNALGRHKKPLRLCKQTVLRVRGVQRLPNEPGPLDHLRRRQ